MPFETFIHDNQATVVFSHDSLTLDSAAQKLLGSPQHVVLAFDREHAVVGVRPAGSNDEPGALPVQPLRNSNARIPYPGFLDWANLPQVPTPDALTARWSNADRMLCVDLRQDLAKGPR